METIEILAFITARCYTERGYATVSRLSFVCLWRSRIVIT